MAEAAAPHASQGRHKAGNTPQAWCRLLLTLLEGKPCPQLLIYPPAPRQPPADVGPGDGKVQAGGPGLPALPLVLDEGSSSGFGLMPSWETCLVTQTLSPSSNVRPAWFTVLESSLHLLPFESLMFFEQESGSLV